jgi:hypothetical protein
MHWTSLAFGALLFVFPGLRFERAG